MARQQVLLSFIGLAALTGAPALAQDAPPASAAPVRIGIVLPEAQLGQGNSGQDVGEPVRQLIISYMSGPMLELVPLQAKISAQVNAEAMQQNCTHVLFTSVEQKKGGKGMGSMLSMLGPAAACCPALARWAARAAP